VAFGEKVDGFSGKVYLDGVLKMWINYPTVTVKSTKSFEKQGSSMPFES